MEQEYMHLLMSKDYIPILSKRTGNMYIDPNFTCYLFEAPMDAGAFVDEIQDTVKGDAKSFSPLEFLTRFYSFGIKAIYLKERGKQEVVIPLRSEDAKKQFMNPKAYGLLLRLKETGKKKYLREMKTAVMLLPVKLDPREKFQFPAMHYCYSELKSGVRYYVLFVTLQEFSRWAEKVPGEWKPLAVTFRMMERVRDGSPVIINPLNDKVILTDEQLSIITEKEQKKDG
jgi:hypothetical protein